MEGLFSDDFNQFSIDSLPCLLDNPFEVEPAHSPMTVDAGLGGAIKQISGDKFFGSPSHESDSGYSMSSESLQSPGSDKNQDGEFDLLSELKQLGEVGFDSCQDGELADYFGGDNFLDGDSSDGAGSVRSDSRSSQEDLDADMAMCGVTLSEPLIVVSSVPTQTGIVDKFSKASATLDNSKRPAHIQNSVKSTGQPFVKVVRIITTPQVDVTEEDIMNEIEDKNKKNAIQARLNRQKKKAYISDLEGQITSLDKENAQLKKRNALEKSEKESLIEEVAYLKNILANQSALSSLLKNIPNVSNVKLSTSFSLKRHADEDHDYLPKSKRSKCVENAGVCLHVKDQSVSLEFCSQCSSMADSAA